MMFGDAEESRMSGVHICFFAKESCFDFSASSGVRATFAFLRYQGSILAAISRPFGLLLKQFWSPFARFVQ